MYVVQLSFNIISSTWPWLPKRKDVNFQEQFLFSFKLACVSSKIAACGLQSVQLLSDSTYIIFC